MASFWLDLFTPETWEEAGNNRFEVTGFRWSRWPIVSKIKAGDFFVCYLTRVSRLCGILKATSEPYQDEAKAKQVWKSESFPCLIDVKPVAVLDMLHSVPYAQIVPKLSVAKKWKGIIRGSPVRIPPEDGQLIAKMLEEARQNPKEYPIVRIYTKRYVSPSLKKERKVLSEESVVTGAVPRHNEIRDMISEIGKFEGRIAEIEYAIDNLRLDAVWKTIQTGNPKWAFEVQMHGDFYEALTKLKHAWDKWNSRPVLVTTDRYGDQARSLLEGSFHEMKDDARIVNWEKICVSA